MPLRVRQAREMTPDSAAVRTPWGLLLVPLLMLALYARSLDYAFVWTDQGEIVMGLMIQPVDQLARVFREPMVADFDDGGASVAPRYYRPLQVTALSVIDHVFGRKPRGFRALNLVLGAITAWAVAWIAFSLLGNTAAALFAGAIYALHPANLENYVWIAGLSHALAACWIALSLGFGIAFLRAGAWWRGAGSLVFLVLALLSKENAVVTPLLLLSCAIALEAREGAGDVGVFRIAQRALAPSRRAFPLVAAQTAIAALYLFWLRPFVLGGAAGGQPMLGNRLGIQLPSALGSWPSTLAWLLVPITSTSSDVVRVFDSFLRAPVVGAGVLVAGSFALWILWTRRGLELAALGLAWIWIAFAPTSGLIPINHMRGERYVSLSLLGLALLLPSLALHLWSRGRERWWRIALVAVCVVVLLGYAVRSTLRMPEWRTERTLFEADLARDPLYREAYLQLAVLSIRKHDFAAAKQMLERLRAIGPRFAGHSSYLNPSKTIGLYCAVNLELGKGADSLDYFRDLDPDAQVVAAIPSLAYCGAMSLLQAGQWERAVPVLERLYFRTREYSTVDTAARIALAYAEAGRADDARRWLPRVAVAPADPALRERVARAREALRENPEADRSPTGSD